MKNSYKIKQILVDLAANDKIPSDMNQLDPSIFFEFDEPDEPDERVGGFRKSDIKFSASQREITLTPEELDTVFSQLKKLDGEEIGIGWTTIEDTIAKVLNQN